MVRIDSYSEWTGLPKWLLIDSSSKLLDFPTWNRCFNEWPMSKLIGHKRCAVSSKSTMKCGYPWFKDV